MYFNTAILWSLTALTGLSHAVQFDSLMPEFAVSSPAPSPSYQSHHIKHCGRRHKDKKCGDGGCCSVNGFCGTTDVFCGKHCQPKYGLCRTPPPPTEIRCGKNFNNTICPDSKCCSAGGWCGKGSQFCTVPQSCQRNFGICDSDLMPNGYNMSQDSRPQKDFSTVEFGKAIDGCDRAKTIALTFDDGPSEYTHSLLDILKSYGARATFFLTGVTNGKGQIDRSKHWINSIRRMMVEGHQIASHTWSHPNMTMVPSSTRQNEMYYMERALANILGKYPSYMRSPYNSCPDNMDCMKDMDMLGYHVIRQDVDSNDWRGWSFNKMKNSFDDALDSRPDDGNMMLIQHDTLPESALYLTEHVLQRVKEKGWQATTMGECLNDPQEKWYRYPRYSEPAQTPEGACLVSATNFCGRISSFQDKQQCKTSLKYTRDLHSWCEKSGTDQNACQRFKKALDLQEIFCTVCHDGEGKDPRCRDESFIIDLQN